MPFLVLKVGIFGRHFWIPVFEKGAKLREANYEIE
jgi:hypothetical protein